MGIANYRIPIDVAELPVTSVVLKYHCGLKLADNGLREGTFSEAGPWLSAELGGTFS